MSGVNSSGNKLRYSHQFQLFVVLCTSFGPRGEDSSRDSNRPIGILILNGGIRPRLLGQDRQERYRDSLWLEYTPRKNLRVSARAYHEFGWGLLEHLCPIFRRRSLPLLPRFLVFFLSDVTVLYFVAGIRFSLMDDLVNNFVEFLGMLLVSLAPGLPGVSLDPRVSRNIFLEICVQLLLRHQEIRTLTISHSCMYSLLPVLPPVSLYGILRAIHSQSFLSSSSLNCVRLCMGQ